VDSKLAEFRVKIAYVKGVHNAIADALSRSPNINPEDLKRIKSSFITKRDLGSQNISLKRSIELAEPDE